MSIDLILKLLILMSVGGLFSMPMPSQDLFYCFKFPSAVLIIILIFKTYKKCCYKYKQSLFLIISILFINCLRSINEIEVETISSVLFFIIFIYLIIISDQISFSPSLKKWVYYCTLANNIILIYFSLSPVAHWNGHFFEEYLTFGFYNSNFAGIIAFIINSIFLVSGNTKKFWKKIFNYAIYLWMVYLIFQTNCRSAFVASLIILVLFFLFVKFRLPKTIIYLFLVVPVLFVPFYIEFAKEHEQERMEILGKGVVSGRQHVYKEVLSELEFQDILIGKISKGGVTNAHNAALSIFLALGIFGCIAFGYILCKVLLRDNENAVSRNAKIAIYAILASIIESCGEAVLFIGMYPIVIYMFFIFSYAGSDNNSKSHLLIKDVR